MKQPDAERRKVVAINLADAELATELVIPENKYVMNDAALFGGHLLTTYLCDAHTQMRRFTLDGTADGTDQLPGIGSAKAWHRAGQLENKQNVFDDFIAVSEFLITQGITMETGLVVQGESNGGLVVDAVVNQRPDLYAAALPGRKLSDRFGASVSALRVQ